MKFYFHLKFFFIEVKDGFIRIKDMTGPQGDPFGSMYTAFHDFSGQYFSFEFQSIQRFLNVYL